MVEWTPLHDPMEPIAHRADLLGPEAAVALDRALLRLLIQTQNARAPSAGLDLQITDYLAAMVAGDERLRVQHAYTASLDFALTLMPPDWCWDVGRLPEGPGLFYANAWPDQVRQTDHFTAITPALALCCAALIARHRAHQHGSERPRLHLVE
jgi:hypothetical protein